MAYNYAAARAAGLTDQQIEQYLNSKGRSLETEGVQTPQAPSQSQAKSNPLLDLLPVLGAIGGSFTPFGPILGGAGGAALSTGAKQLFQGQPLEGGEIGKEALFGGIGGVAGKGIVGIGSRLLGKGAQTAAEFAPGGVKGIGQALRQSVIKPQVAATARGAEKEAELLSKAKGLGLKGTAQAQRVQSVQRYNEIIGEIESNLKLNNPIVNPQVAKSVINNAITGSLNYDRGTAIWRRALSNRTAQVGSLKNTQELLKYKLELGDQLTPAFKKRELGTPLTVFEEAGLATWEAVDNIIAQTAPEIADATRSLSALHQLAPGLKKSAEKGISLPIVGKVPGVTSAVQGAADITGRTLENVGSLPFPSLGGLAAQSAGQLGVRAGIEGQTQQPQQLPQIPETQPMESSGINEALAPIDQDLTFMGRPVSKAQLVQLMIQNPKHIKTIKEIFEFENPQLAGGKMDANIQKETIKIGNAENIVDQVEGQFKQLGITGRGVGQVRGAFAGLTGLDPQVDAYNSIRDASIGPLARAISSEVGVLTDQDIKRADRLLPSLNDTPEAAKLKIQQLRQAIQRRKKLLGNLPIPQNISPSLGGE